MKGCRNCTNWDSFDEHLDRIDPATSGQKVQIGLCKRYAPQPLTHEAGNAIATTLESTWPRVPSDSWCGEWNPKFD